MDKYFGGYISTLLFNNGESVDINNNDIVLFVGPNNVGKSQALQDINTISGGKTEGKVVKNFRLNKYENNVTELLDKIASPKITKNGTVYYVLGNGYLVSEYTNQNFRDLDKFDYFTELFVANLDTAARLSICQPATIIPRDSPKENPIQFAAFDGKYRKWLSDKFCKAFGECLIPNTTHGGNIPLCIGEPVVLKNDYEDEQTRQEAYADILGKYKQVQKQGDGIKSFTGILLYLMMDHFCTYLIDEPESFLHPPQARIMGQIIGETLNDHQQAFISTHSEELIKGLLETCPEKLKIIRITRKGDTNSFSVLSNEKLRQVWKDPLLKHSNIISGIFHKTVVLCESDSDCQMYSIIDNYQKQSENKYPESIFLHCGGKQRMPKILSALNAIGVEVKTIIDLDVLNDETVLKNIITACGVPWDSIKEDYRILIANLCNKNGRILRRNAATCIQQIFNGSNEEYLGEDEIKKIQESIKSDSIWSILKKNGSKGIPSGDASAAFSRLNQKLINLGIHVVLVGELECFIKEVGGHGPNWVNSVLEKYPSFDDPVYHDINEFIRQINI